MQAKSQRLWIARSRAQALCMSVLFVIMVWLTAPAAFGETAPGRMKLSEQVCSVKQGIVLLVEFHDVGHSVNRSYVQKRFSSELNDYVRAMSYGKACIAADVTERWYRMPGPISDYRISPRNLEVDKARVMRLIRDTLDAADKDVDFSRYSFAAIFMGAKREEYGMIGLCGYPGMLGWGTGEILRTKRGQTINGGIAIFSYQAHLGTLFHDVAHILGGVREGKRVMPCLYDHDLQARPGPIREVFLAAIVNMGLWDPMSCHFYKWGEPPPGMCAWTKLRMNWIDPSKIRVVRKGERADLTLGPLADGESGVLAVKIPLSDATYYLIENRQPIGFDQQLPGSGILISYADDRVPECRHGAAPVKLVDADPKRPYLAGAAFDVGKRTSFVDEKNGLGIEIVERIGNSYRIRITPGVK